MNKDQIQKLNKAMQLLIEVAMAREKDALALNAIASRIAQVATPHIPQRAL